MPIIQVVIYQKSGATFSSAEEAYQNKNSLYKYFTFDYVEITRVGVETAKPTCFKFNVTKFPAPV